MCSNLECFNRITHDRKSLVLNVGGGVVDLGGFVASLLRNYWLSSRAPLLSISYG
jgi:hypothetical protein